MFRFIRRWFQRTRFGREVNTHEVNWEQFQEAIDYRITDRTIFQKALTHSSFSASIGFRELPSNERLEFLGDAVLSMVIGEMLFRRYPDISEGELTKMRASLVSSHGLAQRAREIGLGHFLLLGDGEEKSGGRNKNSILANAYEALIGAIYLDGGLQATVDFIRCNIWEAHETILKEEGGKNFKGDLLEYCQKMFQHIPRYFLVKEEGEEHSKVFTIQVKIAGKTVGIGTGKNKKEAEQQAAADAVKKIKSSQYYSWNNSTKR